jgi:metal-responsive CopG/Arc/MetJ family transcriptional regulator
MTKSTVPLRRIALTVPADLVAEVDQVARERHESRSRFITNVLRQAVRARRDADITRRLDEFFADQSLAEEQRRSAAALDAAGTDRTS